MDSQTDPQQVHFAASIRLDRDQFLRRTCPSCGLDFKTEANAADLQWLLEDYCRRSGLDIGERPQPERPRTRIRCPYCGHDDEVNRTLTEETVEYLKRILYREVVLPQMNSFFAGMEDSFGSRHSGGMFSISVEFKHNRMMQPARPIHGPDSSEFKVVELLCCGGRIKVWEGWLAVDVCPFCRAEVAIT